VSARWTRREPIKTLILSTVTVATITLTGIAVADDLSNAFQVLLESANKQPEASAAHRQFLEH
jgi:hypothetical protein